jgi:hypothetical protein
MKYLQRNVGGGIEFLFRQENRDMNILSPFSCPHLLAKEKIGFC